MSKTSVMKCCRIHRKVLTILYLIVDFLVLKKCGFCTLMDVPIYFKFDLLLYYYICLCTTVYDLSTLVGCRSV